jgi:hypothetical protein
MFTKDAAYVGSPLPLKDIAYEDDTKSIIFEYFQKPVTTVNKCTHLESLTWDSSAWSTCAVITAETACIA